MDIFSEKVTLRFKDIDGSDTQTIASTFDFFQEAAISHAEILGAGRDAMKQKGMVWVLSRIAVFMERRPRYGETLTVRTWPRGWHKLFAVRDYDIRDADDNPVVRGRSGWLILDLEKRRPLRPQAEMAKLPLNEGINALLEEGAADNEVRAALKPAEWTTAPTLRRALYSDIDYNGHMNNTRYIQWIQDLTEGKILERARQIRLDINYLSEVLYGEDIELFTGPFAAPGQSEGAEPENPAAAFVFEGRRNGPNGKESVFRAELKTGT